MNREAGCEVQVACERATAKVRGELRRGFTGLRVVAVTVFLVGLLGYVLGVMNSTPGFAADSATILGAMAGRLSEAGLSGAFGLFVAIAAYAQLQLWTAVADRFDVQMRIATLDLVQWARAIEAAVPGPPPRPTSVP